MVHLTVTIILFTIMCIANLAMHFEEVQDDPANIGLNGGEIFYKVFSQYWASLIGGFIAVLFSIFVFGLCGFHTYLINRNLTT